jgi:hypothetical protein
MGIGAPYNFTEISHGTVTELTYMELLRSFGILFGVPMLLGLFYPLGRLANHRWRSVHYLYLGYAVYLYLCSANPFLVSSSGMLVFSIVLAQTFSVPQVPGVAIRLVEA